MIDLDFRAALRSLSRSPGLVTAAVLSLTLGIGTGAASCPGRPGDCAPGGVK